MTREEVNSLLLYKVCKPSEIKFFKKVVVGQAFTTSPTISIPDSVTVVLPQEARYFFGFRRKNDTKTGRNCTLILNDEKIIEDASNLALDAGNGFGQADVEYIECGRKLTGSDSMFYKIAYGFQSSESIAVFLAIDVRLMPKEGK